MLFRSDKPIKRNNYIDKKKYKNNYLDLSEDKNKTEKKKDLVINTREIIKYGEKVINTKELKGNKYIDKEGNYFISHPKLKYVKGDLNMKSWKTNELLDSFPKELLKHKFNSKAQKNHLIIFPSSINQIFVNLEKLRIHNNFKKIENDLKEKNK